MYLETKNSKKYNICGITCYRPPVGQVYNIMTGKWESREILKRASKKENQYWERPTPPANYELKRKKEILAQKTDPEYYNPELQAYRNQEWDRRLNGFWFYNNGVATYVTGLHYFYLVHWKIDVGYPQFRITDLEFFYFLQYCIDDPNCMGMIEVTKRRQGKTMRAGAFLYEYVSRSKNKTAAIQSKTFDDAKENVFAKGVVMPFKYLPDFFIPIYDTEKGMTPKGDLRFFKTNKRGAIDDIFAKKEELESEILVKSSDIFAVDGKKVHRYLGDEAGKTKNVNVWERHQVVQFCLMEEEKIVGKALYTTTVEEMEDGGESFKELWDASDQSKRDGIGRTKSGLYRYFMPAYRTLYYDQYGFPDEEKTKSYYMAQREALMSDPRALASYIRKNPFNIEEAFFSEAETCLFDAMAINRQIESVMWADPDSLYYRGEFVWEKGVRDSKVVFKETQNGKFLVNRKINPFSTNEFNNVLEYGSSKAPNDKVRFCMGVDPFDHDDTVSSQRSDGAAYVFHKYSTSDPDLSETFLVQYLHRPPKAELFYEDMIKLAHFFGCEVLIEDQKIGLIKYFKARGYGKFFYRIKGSSKEGISASSKVHQEIVENIESLAHDNLEKVIFVELLKDWLKFEIKKTTKYDATMASGYTLIAAGNSKFIKEDKSEKKIYEIRDVFPF